MSAEWEFEGLSYDDEPPAPERRLVVYPLEIGRAPNFCTNWTRKPHEIADEIAKYRKIGHCHVRIEER